MQQRGSKPFSRSFSRKNKGKRRNNNNNQNFSLRLSTVLDSNGPSGHIKGTCQQLVEKYVALAKEWRGQDDIVNAENCQQYADHYARLLAGIMERAAEYRAANNGKEDNNEDDADREDIDSSDDAEDSAEEAVEAKSDADSEEDNSEDDVEETIDENIKPAAFQGLNVAFLNKEVQVPSEDDKPRNIKRGRGRNQSPRHPKKDTSSSDDAKEDIA